MRKEDNISVKDYYNHLLHTYGPNSAETLHWQSTHSQQVRFAVLSEIGSLENKSILDVGCGLGDLYGFLKNNVENFSYTGIDINENLINQAQKKYPEAKFLIQSFEEIEENYDYLIASGAFSFSIPKAKTYYFKIIEKLFKHANYAFAFNLLNNTHHPSNSEFISYSKEEVHDFCAKISHNFSIRQDYLPHDFTVYLYHKS